MKSLNMCRFQWIITLFLPLCLAPTCQPITASGGKDPNLFGIYVSTLDGKNMKPIINDSYRELNHARVSPDNKWVTFTRFNKRGKDGLARETGPESFLRTEIMRVRIDGTGMESLNRAQRGIVVANSYWTPDGKGLIYMFNNLLKKEAQISRIDIATRKISRVPTPAGLLASDPHTVGNQIVFPVVSRKGKPSSIWIMNLDGTNARQLTDPRFSEAALKMKPPPGDSDCKLSPDGTKVALMRHVSGDDWHIIIVDVKTGQERDISKGVTCDAMPEWSSDGKLLIFWHADRKNLRKSGLYTIRPDGSDRKRIPLPRGYFYTMPAFFPGEGSDDTTRIIFNAVKVPGM